jgi:small subunit ribosomal protein S13
MRLVGVNIPDAKRVEVALTYIFGIGSSRSKEILKATAVSPDKRAKDLSPDEVNKLKEYIEGALKIEGDLKREVLQNIKRQKDIQSYRGIRHAKGLPVRGQQTRTNTRTRRGNVRKPAGSGRKPTAQKT